MLASRTFAALALLAVAGHATAVTYAGSAPAVHMELKTAAGTKACSAYGTPAGTAPTCEVAPGSYTEQLFGPTWQQISNKPVTVGASTGQPPAASNFLERFYVVDNLDPPGGENPDAFCGPGDIATGGSCAATRDGRAVALTENRTIRFLQNSDGGRGTHVCRAPGATRMFAEVSCVRR